MLRSGISAFCAAVSLALFSSPAQGAPTGVRGPALFGTAVLAAAATPYDAGWTRVQSQGLGNGAAIAAKAKRLHGIERLQFVNQSVNAAITYRGDSGDFWASASQSFSSGAGDCEDYAIAKMQVLRAAGVPAADTFLVLGNLGARGDHALLVVRVDATYFVLDNLSEKVRTDTAYGGFRPVVTFSSQGSWLHGYKVGSQDRAGERAAATGSSLAAIKAAQKGL